MTATKKCKVEGCKRAYRAKGYCNVHFHKWRRGEMPVKPRHKTCSEEGCHKPLHRFGMCQQHCEAWIASRKPQAPAEATAPAAAPAPEAPSGETPAQG